MNSIKLWVLGVVVAIGSCTMWSAMHRCDYTDKPIITSDDEWGAESALMDICLRLEKTGVHSIRFTNKIVFIHYTNGQDRYVRYLSRTYIGNLAPGESKTISPPAGLNTHGPSAIPIQ